MFRLSHYLHELLRADAARPGASAAGAGGDLEPDPALQSDLQALLLDLGRRRFSRRTVDRRKSSHVMDDLKAFRVPVLILSGGEPLMRRDIFEISERAKAMRSMSASPATAR